MSHRYPASLSAIVMTIVAALLATISVSAQSTTTAAASVSPAAGTWKPARTRGATRI